MKHEPLFYIERAEQNVAGPYDLVQMGGLLRRKIITAETSVRREGEEDWKPFCEHPQFIVAREMPPNALSTRVVELTEEAQAGDSPIPLPSREFMIELGGMAAALLLSGLMGYFMAWLNVSIGICLIVAGGIASIMAQCLILAKMMEEDYLMLVLVALIPFFDVYYFLANFDKYLPYFFVKYIGAIVAVAAWAVIANSHSAEASNFRALFGR